MKFPNLFKLLAFLTGGAMLLTASPFVIQTVIDPTGNSFINLLGINNGGTIAGFDNNAPAQGFTLVLPNNFSSENFPGSTSSMVTGINQNGDTVGIYTDAAGNTHGFTDIGGSFKTVDNPASPVFNQGLGINNSDETVGYYAPTQLGTTGQIAYSQSGGVFSNVNSLLPANFNSQAVGVNNVGNIVGFFMPTATTSVGFLDVGGTISMIDPFGSTFTPALGINNLGEIVGFYLDGSSVQHGYIDIGGVFTSFDPPASTNTTINGVNDLGDIVGFYTDANDNVIGFVGTTTPEPATLALVGAGLLACLGVLRRRNGSLKIG
jgi:hypothetical protein